MTTTAYHPAGPVDVAVLTFHRAVPADRLSAAIAQAVAAGSVSVLDVLVVEKDASGELTIVDVDTAEEAAAVLGFPAVVPGLLGEEDADAVATELAPGTGAVLIAWENVWMADIASVVRQADGALAAYERIPAEDVVTALEALARADEGAPS